MDYLATYPGRIDFKRLQLAKEKNPPPPPPLLSCRTEKIDLNAPIIKIGACEEISTELHRELEVMAKGLMPWKKGPFDFFGHYINSEWRSNIKWDRIVPHLDKPEGKIVLDVGCNNGYFLFRLIGRGAKEVLGIDPVGRYIAQFNLLQQVANIPHLHLEPWGIKELSCFEQVFDIILYLGIIYHHPNPIEQLVALNRALKPGGQLIVESLGIPGKEPVSLTPRNRYAQMKNIYFIPTLKALENWAIKAKFRRVAPLFSLPASCDEQRVTNWCPAGYKSFADFLYPGDPSKTKEGYPAPYRLAISAEK